VLLKINNVDDVSNADFASVMEEIIIPSCDENIPIRLVFGDGLGHLDMPKNVLQQ
jgi:hypothetical protein